VLAKSISMKIENGILYLLTTGCQTSRPKARRKDYENLTRSHVGFIILAMIRLMLRRIVRLQGAS
jgi:hypothetical protein